MPKDGSAFAKGAEFMRMLLLHPHGWHVDAIREHFRLSDTRTVRGYLQKLRESGFPGLLGVDGEGAAQKGDDGRVRWRPAEGRPIDDTSPSAVLGVLASIHFSTQLLRFLKGTPLAEAINQTHLPLREALTTLTPKLKRTLRNADRMFYIVPDAPKDYTGREKLIEQLVEAIAFSKEIRVDYASRNGGSSSRVLQPLTLLSYRSALYIVARKPGNTLPKTYAIDRMGKIDVLRQEFRYPGDTSYHPDRLFDGSLGIFTEDDWMNIKLRFATDRYDWLAPTITERQWHPSQRFDTDAQGRLTMTLRARSKHDIVRWLLGYGHKVEVLAPVELAEAVEEAK